MSTPATKPPRQITAFPVRLMVAIPPAEAGEKWYAVAADENEPNAKTFNLWRGRREGDSVVVNGAILMSVPIEKLAFLYTPITLELPQ